MTYWFDMDGTIADLYGVDGWLEMLIDENPMPYMVAEPLVNLSLLARRIHQVQKAGAMVGIISWNRKSCSKEYYMAVVKAKLIWLKRHLPSVVWDEIKIVPYGTNKKETCGDGILFDDELKNRQAWGDGAYEPSEIFNILKVMR